MRRLEIVARGDVQRVGFRDAVQRAARRFGIFGTVENQEPYDVKIVAEGGENALREFSEAIRMQKPPIVVEDLEARWISATGEFPYFKIIRGEWQEELGVRFDAAIGLLHRSVELSEQNLVLGQENLAVGKENLAVSREALVVGKENLAVSREALAVGKENLAVSQEGLAVGKENLSLGMLMLEKQDTTITILESVKEDTSSISVDTGIVREDTSSIKEDIAVMREEITKKERLEILDEKYDLLISEVAARKSSFQSDLLEHIKFYFIYRDKGNLG